MNHPFQELAERLRGEAPDLERMVQRALYAWAQVQNHSSGEQEVYLDSAALNLHGFYSGLERLFELIARHVDGILPAGDAWHRDLLQQMGHELAEVRPAVIGQDQLAFLDRLRRFRHLVRNVYTIDLQPEKIAPLTAVLANLWPRLQAELLAFAEFLEEAGRANAGEQENT